MKGWRLALAALLVGVFTASAAAARKPLVFFENKTKESVRMAFHVRRTPSEQSWETKGWWELPPGAKLAMPETFDGDTFHYYARQLFRTSARVWGGGGPTLPIIAKMFFYRDPAELPNMASRQMVSFATFVLPQPKKDAQGREIPPEDVVITFDDSGQMKRRANR